MLGRGWRSEVLTVFTCETDQQLLVDFGWANLVPSSGQNNWFSPEKQNMKEIKIKRTPYFFNIHTFLWTKILLAFGYYEFFGGGIKTIELFKLLLTFQGKGFLSILWCLSFLSWKWTDTKLISSWVCLAPGAAASGASSNHQDSVLCSLSLSSALLWL